MEKSIKGRAFAVYAANVIVTLLVPLVPGVVLSIVIAIASGGRNLDVVFSMSGTMIWPFTVTWVGILASILILPPIRLFWPKLNFDALILAGCFALAPVAHILSFYLTPQTDPLAGDGLYFVLVATGATIPVALVFGLFQRPFERMIVRLQALAGRFVLTDADASGREA